MRNTQQAIVLNELKESVTEVNDILYCHGKLEIDLLRKVLVKMISNASLYTKMGEKYAKIGRNLGS